MIEKIIYFVVQVGLFISMMFFVILDHLGVALINLTIWVLDICYYLVIPYIFYRIYDMTSDYMVSNRVNYTGVKKEIYKLHENSSSVGTLIGQNMTNITTLGYGTGSYDYSSSANGVTVMLEAGQRYMIVVNSDYKIADYVYDFGVPAGQMHYRFRFERMYA